MISYFTVSFCVKYYSPLKLNCYSFRCFLALIQLSLISVIHQGKSCECSFWQCDTDALFCRADTGRPIMRRGVLMSLLQQNALTLPLWIGKPGER